MIEVLSLNNEKESNTTNINRWETGTENSSYSLALISYQYASF